MGFPWTSPAWESPFSSENPPAVHLPLLNSPNSAKLLERVVESQYLSSHLLINTSNLDSTHHYPIKLLGLVAYCPLYTFQYLRILIPQRNLAPLTVPLLQVVSLSLVHVPLQPYLRLHTWIFVLSLALISP